MKNIKSEKNLKNSFEYLLGWYRYYCFYSKSIWGFSLSWLIRNHIKEQFNARLLSMDLICYTEGSCLGCGCATPALQFANKACENLCYPTMLPRSTWKAMKEKNEIIVRHEIKWYLSSTNNKDYEFCEYK